MKKVILWIGIFVVTFVVLVAITFGGLTYFSADKIENSQIVEIPDNEQLIIPEVNQKQSVVDSLIQLTEECKSAEFFLVLEKDSLLDQINFRDRLIDGYKKSINNLNSDLLSMNKQLFSIKELAKTYETMKEDEMKPILVNVDNATVIAIYKNMSSRNRKTILKALSNVRAAAITQQLAGVQKG